MTDTHAPAQPEGLLSAPTAFAPPEAGGYSRVLLKLSGEAFGGGSVGVDAGIVRSIAEQTAKEEGKPEQAISKIVEGRVNAYFKDFVLLDQPSITEPKRTVKQVIADAGLTVERFARFEIGQA